MKCCKCKAPMYDQQNSCHKCGAVAKAIQDTLDQYVLRKKMEAEENKKNVPVVEAPPMSNAKPNPGGERDRAREIAGDILHLLMNNHFETHEDRASMIAEALESYASARIAEAVAHAQAEMVEEAAQIADEEETVNRERARIHKGQLQMMDIVAADTAKDIANEIRFLKPRSLGGGK